MLRKGIGIIGLLIFLSVSTSSHAQRWFRTSSLEFGILAGASHYSGDLTQTYFETRGLKPAVGLISRYTPNQTVTFRLSAQYGGLEGDDNWYEDENDPESRNLKFKSSLWDFTGAIEINFNSLDVRQKSGVMPFVYTGVSVFKFNPMAQFIYDPSSPHLNRPNSTYALLQERDQEWVELQPLGTEGQGTTEFNERERYHLTQLAIPIGAGLKFKMNNRWTVGVDYGMRITFTDYIDDVSQSYVDPGRLQSNNGPMTAAMADRSPVLHEELDKINRGDPSNNDSYGILNLSLTYRIWGNRPQCPGF